MKLDTIMADLEGTVQNRWKKLAFNAGKIALGLGGFMLSGNTFSQQTELNVKLNRPDGNPARGIVNIQGPDTTINDNSFISPKNYVLEMLTGTDDLEDKTNTLKVFPNPTMDGNINILLKLSAKDYANLDGMIKVYDLTGKVIAENNLSSGTNMQFEAQRAPLLIQYLKNDGTQQILKLINLSDHINANILSSEKEKSIGVLKSTLNSNFTFSFTDPLSNIMNYQEPFSIGSGETYTIDKELDWTEKLIKYTLTTNSNTKLKVKNSSDNSVLDEETNANGTFVNSFSPRFNNETGIPLEFELTGPYTDTAKFTRTEFANADFAVETIRDGHFHLTVTGNGKTYTVKTGTETIATTPVGNETFFKKQGDLVPLEVTVNGTNVSSTFNLNMNKGIFTREVILGQPMFQHKIDGSTSSSIEGKIIKDGTQIYMTPAPGDTTWTTTVGEKFIFTYESANETEQVKVGSKGVPGHNSNELSITVDDNTPAEITFTGLTFSFTQPMHIQNQYSENMGGVNISDGDVVVTTNSNGLATITRTNLATDINNLSLPDYLTNITISKPNIQTLQTSVTSTIGANPEALKKVVQEYEQWLYGTNTSPNGTIVEGWLNGSPVHTATVNGTNYETNHIKRTTKTQTLDSLTFKATNYNKFKKTNLTLVENGNKEEAALTPITVSYPHTANGTASSSIAGKSIINNTQIYMSKAPGDTTWTTTNNSSFTFSWTSNTQNQNVKIGSKKVAGHQPKEATFTVDNSEPTQLTFTGITYNINKPLRLQNQTNEDISNASISGGDAIVTTNSQGRATVTKSNVNTDANNLPLANYVLNLTITKSNIQTLNSNVNATAGTNSESLLNAVQEYLHYFYGTNSSPSGTSVKGWKNGTAVHTATVSGTSYLSNQIKRTTKTFAIDSLTFTNSGYNRVKRTNLTMVENGNKEEATLTPITVSYTHNLDVSALSSKAGKTIINNTPIYMSKAAGDTTWANTSAGIVNFNWTNGTQNQSVKVGSKKPAGHSANEITVAVDDDTDATITFTGLNFNVTHPVHVQNQYVENISGASISGGDATVTTNANGLATITRNNVSTDANNLPFASYSTNLTISKSNIQTLNTSINSIVGTNSEALKNVVQEYLFYLTGAVTPNGTSVEGIKNSTTELSATVSSGTYTTNQIKKTTKTYTLDQVRFSAANFNTKTLNNIILNEGANTQNATLTPITVSYPHVANGTASSSNAAKTIINNTQVYMSQAPGDTTWTTTNNGSFTFSWTSDTQNQNVKIGSKNVAGHQPKEATFTVDNSEPTPITFTALTYNISQGVQVQNQFSENVSGASVAGGDATVTTNASGVATFTRNNVSTDANNVPFANYTTNLTVTKNNIQTLNTTVNSNVGTNSQKSLSVIQEYLFWLTGTVTPNGTSVEGIKNSTTELTATVSSNSYTTNQIKKTTKTYTLDQVRFSAANFETQTLNNVTLSEGANTRNATLTPITVNYTHNLDVSATSSIAGKSIINGTQIYMSQAPGDTIFANTTNGAVNFNWTNTTQNQNVTIGSKNPAGHNPNKTTVTVDDDTDATLTLQGKIYSLTHPVLVQNQYSENVSNATIEGGDATVNTNASGVATITRNNLSTDANNLPFANYSTNLTISKSNIQTLNTSINSTVGTNSQTLKNIVQEYIFWLTGNVTPDGATVAGVENGNTIFNATVGSNTYETNHVTRTTKTLPLSSIDFTATNYEPQSFANVTLNEGANTRNATLSPVVQTPLQVVDFYIDPRTVNGDDISNLTLKFEWDNGDVTYHSVGGNGKIHIQRTEYDDHNAATDDLTEVATVTHENTDAYALWEIYRTQGQSLSALNYAQNQYVGGVMSKTELPITNAPNDLLLYLADKYVQSGTLGTLDMDGTTIRGMMAGRSPLTTVKFIPIPSANKVDIIQLAFNQITGAPVDQSYLNQAQTELNKILSIYTLNDGTNLLNYQFSTVNSTSDAKWLEVQARGFDNVALTSFYATNPSNGITGSTTFTPNGKYRIKNSESMFGEGTSDGDIFEEIYQQFTNNDDPAGLGSKEVVRTTSGNVSQAGNELARLIYLLDLGTKTY